VAVPAQLAALGWRRHAWRRVAWALGACAVGWIPLAVLAIERGSGQLFWIPRPSLKTEGQVILALTSAGFEPNFHPTWAATPLAVLTVALVALALARMARAPSWGAVLAVSWLLVPLVLMWLESLAGQPIFTARNLLLSLPAVALVLGWLLARAAIGWVLVALVLALRVVVLAPSYGISPENWRAATAYVLAAQRPGDCLAFYPLDAQMPFAYYAGRPVRPYVERYETPRVAPGCRRVWLVVSHQGQADGPPGSRAHYARYLAVRSELARQYGPSTPRAFGYASVIWVQRFGPRH
jgi:hypothetical protein